MYFKREDNLFESDDWKWAISHIKLTLRIDSVECPAFGAVQFT